MKNSLIITFFCLTNVCFSQTKECLLKTIEKANILESDCVGSTCREGEQYLNFQKLKKELSEKELLNLTKSKKSVLRSYAYREVIAYNNDNVIDFLIFELMKNEKVLTFEGCIQDLELVSSLVYHEYWNKTRIDALKRMTVSSESESERIMQNRLESDSVMEKLDSIIIYTEKNVNRLLYLSAFENRKHKDAYLPRIEKLAFEKNNAYAVVYLAKYFPIESKEKIKSYFENKFLTVTFKKERDYQFFVQLIAFLLNHNEKNFSEIAVKKLKKNKSIWVNDSDQITKMLEDRGIKI